MSKQSFHCREVCPFVTNIIVCLMSPFEGVGGLEEEARETGAGSHLGGRGEEPGGVEEE